MNRGNSQDEDGSIRLQVFELQKFQEAVDSSNTIFEPRSSSITIRQEDSGDAFSVSSSSFQTTSPAPEQKLTLFALRLAILEKTASGLGTLGFIWATVVLLGGFAITLDKTDFWFITIILLIEGARIFSRSHELEWQHQATWTITDVGFSSFCAVRSSSFFLVKTLKSMFQPMMKAKQGTSTNIAQPVSLDRRITRTWKSSDVPLLPYARWFFISRNVSRLLYWLQLLSATTCVVLSLYKLIKHNYGDVQKGDTDKRNRESALNIFYSLALAEALFFLMEKAY